MDRWKTSFLQVASRQVLGLSRRANKRKVILKSTCRWRARRARDSSDIWTRSHWKQKSALFFSISFPRVWKQYCSTSFLVSFFLKVLQRRFCIRAIPTWPSSCDPRPSRPKGDRNWWGSEMPTKARNVGLGLHVPTLVVFYARPCAHFSLWRHSLLTGCDFIVLIVIIIVVMIIIIIIVMVMKM